MEVTDDDLAFFEAVEGREKFVIHRKKERSLELIKKFKESLQRPLKCEVCDMSFEQIYGKRLGESFIEAHHKQPLSEIKEEKITRLDDLAAVCSNCHRMLHRGKKLLTVADLRSIVIAARHK